MSASDPPAEADQRRPRRAVAFLREVVILLTVALVIAMGIKTFVAQAFYIPSGSMQPQLEVGDRIVVSKLSYRLHEPRRGDVVVFDSPHPQPPDRSNLLARAVRSVGEAIGVAAPSTDEFVKRVIGLPGETVEGRGGTIYVNGRELVEPYLPEAGPNGDFAPVIVPDNAVFVMGDNRSNSADSRVFGPIETSTIVGRAVVRVWPVPTMAFL
ncbi:MAG: signal peptidase I [Actinomycetota bacterium]